MMHFELNDEQAKILAEIIESSLSGLHDEIAHTDTREYRDYLKERKETLTKIREMLH